MGKTELQRPRRGFGLNGRITLRLLLNRMGVCELGSSGSVALGRDKRSVLWRRVAWNAVKKEVVTKPKPCLTKENY